MSDERVGHLQQELIYYKNKTDELAGENLKLDYAVSGLRHEIKQKKAALNLLSFLPSAISVKTEVTEIFRIAVSSINSTLGMDKTIFLVPTDKENFFRPSVVLGSGLDEAHLVSQLLEIPAAIIEGTEIVVMTKTSKATELSAQIRKLFELPYFLISVVHSGPETLGVFISGRSLEARPLYPPLNQGDVDTFASIGSLISATIEGVKVTALKETDRLKTEFFANISHEFRTPITLTVGPLEALLTGRYGEVTERIKKEVEMMLRNQKRLLGFINQILDLAKMESGNVKISYAKTPDFNRFIDQRLEQFQSLADKRGIELIREFDTAVSNCDFYCDQEKIEESLINLLSNAIKFTTKGSITISTKIERNFLFVSVKDTGTGIVADQIPHIFDRFKQADGSKSREFAGTGIGLALVKQGVELHGGEVIVTSEPGIGTMFTLKLLLGKIHISADAIIENGSADEPDSALQSIIADLREGKSSASITSDVDRINDAALKNLRSATPKILYVDDNAELRNFVHGLLKDQYNIFLAVNGKDGFEKTKQYSVDLIISDLRMPIMTGTELLKKIREGNDTKAIPFVMLTANGGMNTKLEELEGGADDFLVKPFSEAELMARIRNLLNIREQQMLFHSQKAIEIKKAFSKYVSKDIVEELLKNEGALELRGQKYFMSVFFSDIRGFTSFSEKMDPIELSELLNKYFTPMSGVITQHRGTIDKYIGDAIMAMFGAPLSYHDHAYQACKAALGCIGALEKLNQEFALKNWPEIKIGIGINTGYMNAGNIGSETIQSYTVIGDSVNLAQRLERLTKEYGVQVIISEFTFALVKDQFHCRKIGKINANGKKEPVTVYELISHKL